MIASCWDWNSLKYVYFLIEGVPLDAGGWSPSKGIARKDAVKDSSKSIAFDDCLPSLPQNCSFVGVGNFCVGELFQKRDNQPRQKADLNALSNRQDPQTIKALELLRGDASSVVESLKGVQPRRNEASALQSAPSGVPNTVVESSNLTLFSPSGSVWEKLLPLITSIGTGYALYKGFDKATKNNLAVRDIIFAWGAGVALGVTIGQEALRQSIIRSKK